MTTAVSIKQRRRAIEMLLGATFFWALSFPLVKSVELVHQRLFGESNSLFTTSFLLTTRFCLATLILAAWVRPSWKSFRREEWGQGIGLGFFALGGLILQTDGLAYADASVSAFLTQFYTVLIPIFTAIRDRRWPSAFMVMCCLMVLGGVTLLADVDWQRFKLGRGEIETLIGAFFFAGQILWLERPKYAHNNMKSTSLIMFGVIALGSIPLGVMHMNQWSDWVVAGSDWTVWFFIVLLAIICTVLAFTIMNVWQPFIDATTASLIYALEPVITTVFAAFLPAFFSWIATISYRNETLTMNVLIGGGLVTLANILLAIRARN